MIATLRRYRKVKSSALNWAIVVFWIRMVLDASSVTQDVLLSAMRRCAMVRCQAR